MSIYKRSLVTTIIITIVSLGIAIIIHCNGYDDFWSGIFVGIFGSALLITITSFIGYFYERRRIMEGFYSETIKFLDCIGKYQTNEDIDNRIRSLLRIKEHDITSLSTYYGNMDFFNSRIKKYTYTNIYRPLIGVRNKVFNKEIQFRYHLSGNGRNDEVMKSYIEEIEKDFIEFVKPNNREDMFISGYKRNYLTNSVFDELNGRYYEYMYWSKRKGSSNDGEA